MRPFPGEEAGARQARVSADNEPAFQQAPPQQMIYFLGDEAAINASLEASSLPSSILHRSRDHRKQPSSSDPPAAEPETAGLKSAVHEIHDFGGASVLTDATEPTIYADDSSATSGSPLSKANLSVANAIPALSQPITPLRIGPSGPASAISGLSSRRNSLTASMFEEMGSQTFSMRDELEQEPSSSMMDSGSAPQLVMPSIKMPSRRPFTEEGKRIGRLKVLIAGDSGIGKTSLLKALVQSCEHIVHVDPIIPQQISAVSRPSLRPRRPKSSRSSIASSTGEMTEIFASTKPYPEWWSDLDDFRVLKRKKSLGDTILDRNICFIDTPGYAQGASCMETIAPVIRYVESHFERVQANATNDPDMLNMLGGDGGSQVDVVFYLIRNKLKPVDLQYIRLLARLTNVIPLLAQVDTMSSEDVMQRKAQIKRELLEADIRPFSFTVSSTGTTSAHESNIPYGISSTPGSDHDMMDASLLMSPDYVQPLVPSELSDLVEQVFCENGASWLRHAAGRKFLQWRNSDKQSRPQALYRPLSLPGGPSNSLVAAAPMTVGLARIADHTQREERLAQIRLANWAADLQRSLANERIRYENLARSERAIWLTEKLSECVQDGTLVAVEGRGRSRSGKSDHVRRKQAGERGQGPVPHQDPLGLLQVSANLRAKGWIALEIIGGLGVVGGLTLWASKSYLHLPAVDWAVEEWSRFWYGDQ